VTAYSASRGATRRDRLAISALRQRERRERDRPRGALARLEDNDAKIVAAKVFGELGEGRDCIRLRLQAEGSTPRGGIEHQMLEHRSAIDARPRLPAGQADRGGAGPLAVAEGTPGIGKARASGEVELGRWPQPLGR